MRKFSMAMAAVSIAITPVFAAKTDDGGPKDEVICKREQVVGSHIAKRRCMTRAQWDELAKESQAQMRRQQEMNRRADGS